MTEIQIKIKDRIPRRSSHELILNMARFGHYANHFKNKPDAEIKRTMNVRGVKFEEEVEKCRTFSNNVIFFENLIGSTWTISKGAKISVVDNVTGKESDPIEGPGTIALGAYNGLFEQSLELLKESIEKNSYSLYLSSITNGIASIEAYIKEWTERYNYLNPDIKLIDTKHNKVSFDDKIDNWIPQMLNGKKLDKGNTIWAHFKILRSIRDKEAVHFQTGSFGISYKDLVEKMNLYKTGIAGMLFELHKLFNQVVPSNIIRVSYFPEIYLDD